MKQLSFPTIRVKGNAYDRGSQYGAAAADRVRQSIAIYTNVFAHQIGWSWGRVTAHAEAFYAAIEKFRPHLLAEMEGIAHGAGVSLADIVALNIRTEIINMAEAWTAGECTAFIAQPDITQNGHVVIGQNWDWKEAASETVVVLEVEADGLPNYMTVVEAGLMAKCGINDTGLGLVTNALNSSLDTGQPGVPYHVLLRAVLEATSVDEAYEILVSADRASAANYLVADGKGNAFNVEAAPGGEDLATTTRISNGVFVHTNHYLLPTSKFNDLVPSREPDTLYRHTRFQEIVGKLSENEKGLRVAHFQSALADHGNYPSALCCHPIPASPAVDRYATVASVIMDLETATVWIADGNPCQTEYLQIEYNSVWA